MAVCRHAEYFSGCLESLDGFVFHPRSRYGCRDGALSAGRTQVAIVFCFYFREEQLSVCVGLLEEPRRCWVKLERTSLFPV